MILSRLGGGKPEEEKTVTAGTSVIEVSPSSGKTIKKVTLYPTPTETKEVSPTTTDQTYNPPEGKHFSQFTVKATEDVTPEVNAQPPILTQIQEAIVGKAQGANATADKILEGYSAYVGGVLLNGTATKSGAYVWKKLTSQGGDLVDFVTADVETAYPDGGTQDGYWYERFDSAVKGIDFGIVTPTSDMTSITVEHNLGKNPTYMGIWNPSGIVGYTTPAVFDNWYVYSNTNNSGNAGAAQKCGKSETTATFNAYDSGYPFKSGQSYIWVVIA